MKQLIVILALTTLVSACKTKTQSDNDNWIYLFDGTNTEGWRAFNGSDLPPKWVIKDSTLTFDTEKRLESDYKGGNDIIYAKETFDNFELYLEWKIPQGGNSGVFYHVKEGYKAMHETAPEYQLLDDLNWEAINNAKLEDWQKTGADYAMYVPDISKKIVKPADTWNTSRIRFTPELAEYWLNGEKILQFVPWSDDWHQRKAKGKWKDFPDYGKFKTGYIGLQDHDSPIWFRNIKIKKL
ncbi:DUF1080 domain-containing protein [Seonamhaeicola sp.]|uniref:3-keto-disaccharide hydrolase n=1 Tax=Seonamhaeicola sp. TaxID=1912245 RepID=UPI002638A93F|nr:DUF1080 domain-containing protein [Seonamhaeicola sp.]